jgi:regulator of sigma E protease
MGIISFVVVLSLLVFVHELGHFLAAKLMGIWVQEFSIGMPPRIFSKKFGETQYTLGLLPIGGFVKLYGEEGAEAGNVDKKRAFFAKSPGAKLFVLLAGVFMNFLVGVILMGVIFSTVGKPTPHYAVLVEEVKPDSPALKAGLAEGTYILSLGSAQEEPESITTLEEFREIVGANLNQPMVMHVALSQEDLLAQENFQEITITPEDYFNENRGSLGVQIALVGYPIFDSIPWYRVPQESLIETVRLVGLMVTGLRTLITNLAHGIVPTDIAGPVGIAVLSQEVAKQGIVSFIQFIALISINLAVINVLPFPALDGGRVIFIIGEMVVGHALDTKIQQWIHLAGIIFLLGLMAVITVYDVIRFL